MSVERDGIQTPTDERQTEARKVQDFEEWGEDTETGEGEAETAGKHEELSKRFQISVIWRWL